MLTYYVTLYRVAEAEGTTTATVKRAYSLRAWNSEEAVRQAHERIRPGHTYEYLMLSRAKPKGVEVMSLEDWK